MFVDLQKEQSRQTVQRDHFPSSAPKTSDLTGRSDIASFWRQITPCAFHFKAKPSVIPWRFCRIYTERAENVTPSCAVPTSLCSLQENQTRLLLSPWQANTCLRRAVSIAHIFCEQKGTRREIAVGIPFLNGVQTLLNHSFFTCKRKMIPSTSQGRHDSNKAQTHLEQSTAH